jgi:hypothetical protein
MESNNSEDKINNRGKIRRNDSPNSNSPRGNRKNRENNDNPQSVSI